MFIPNIIFEHLLCSGTELDKQDKSISPCETYILVGGG